MHATIYQIDEEKPIEECDYITDEDLPEWFWAKMDYADTVDPEYALERAAMTGSRPGLHFDAEKRLLTVEDKEEYFKAKYEEFKENAKVLADCTLEQFAQNRTVSNAVYRLNFAFDDEYGIYVYSEERGLETLDYFVRRDGEQAYIGAVLDYHY